MPDASTFPLGGALMRSPADSLPLPSLKTGEGESEGTLADRVEQWNPEIEQTVKTLVDDARLYLEGDLSPARAEAERYYKGEPFGNEVDGRSKVVITTLRDTVLMMMPSLMRIFSGAENAVEYGPSRDGQTDMAEQVTRFVTDVVLSLDNNGFLLFHDWFKDALIKRLGVVKYTHNEAYEVKTYYAKYLTLEAVSYLQDNDEIDIQDIYPCETSPPGTALYDVDYKTTRNVSNIQLTVLPPDEFLFSRSARVAVGAMAQPGVAAFAGHMTHLTRGQLEAMGVSKEDIETYGFPDIGLQHNVEQQQRDQGHHDLDQPLQPALRKTLYIEGYPFLDLDDGEGLGLCKVLMIGPSYHVLSIERCARRPFAVLTPDPTPHMIVGQGISDYTMDMQKIMSMVWRNILNSLALSLRPRMGYVENEVSLEDLTNMEIGAPIRMRSQGALQEIAHTFIGREALPVLQALTDVIENRVGVTKASAGLDPKALQSTTAAGVAAAVTNAQAHIEMIARIFAETGVKQLFRGILELVVEHPDRKRIARVNGAYIEMDPNAWDANLDVRVNVAIGAGLADERYATLLETAQEQRRILFGEGQAPGMGLDNPLVTVKQYRETLVKMLKLKGRMDAETFYRDPDTWQAPPPPPEQPDPNMEIARAEVMKAESEVAKERAKVQLDGQKAQIDLAREMEDLRLHEREMQLIDTRERERTEAEMGLKLIEIRLKHQTDVTLAEAKAAGRELVKREATVTDPDGRSVTTKESTEQ